jgi:hypothetical protein
LEPSTFAASITLATRRSTRLKSSMPINDITAPYVHLFKGYSFFGGVK